ncbi:MAG: rhodanese-like domain-containing protein [Cyanobacteriota bacterium]|nr:rhodanese-like domain-containing protein [Cyanobacteriota bacterium]
MTPSPQEASPRSITAPALALRLRAGDPPQLVDVREEEELALARFPHPVEHLPLSRASEWLETLPARLDRERPVVVLCHAGVRSWRFACWLLAERGYREVWNLEGGIDAWSVGVDPSIPRY